MAATAALSAAAVADLAASPNEVPAFTVALALAIGVLALAAGLLRMGFLANFISEPVLKGFIVGLALTIIVGQVPKVLGIEKAEGNFFEQLWGVVRRLGDTEALPLAIGLSSLVVVLALRAWAPVVPGSLVAVLGSVIAVSAFHLDDHGLDIVGHIDRGLPSLGLPHGLGLDDYLATAASAVGVMLVGFVEGLGAAKTYAAANHYEVDPNRELIGLGGANIGAALSSGMVVNGSLSKTAVNGSAGAKSQLSGIVVAVMTVVTLLFLTGLFEDLPEATLAAVVIAALVELVDVRTLLGFHRLWTQRLGSIYGRAARPDFLAAMAALCGVLLFDTLPGLFIGIGVSLVLLLYRASRPHVAELGRRPGDGEFADLDRHPDNVSVDGVVILRPEAGLFFANAEAVRGVVLDAVGSRPGTVAVVLDAESMPYIDVTSLRMLDDLAERLAELGVALAIARDIGQVRDLLRLEHPDGGGSIALYPTVSDAVADLGDRLGG
jgi:MFS superfamily sulfate permease-like transporter